MPGRKPLVLIGSQIERLPAGDFVQLGKLNIGPPNLIDVVGPAITVSSSHAEVTSPVNTTVLTINGGEPSDILYIHGQSILTKKINFDLGGNLILPKKRTVEGPQHILALLNEGGFWYEVSWSG